MRVEPRAIEVCWLCGRIFGKKVEWHHPIPKSRGGRETVPVHPICHRTIHASFDNHVLASMSRDELLSVPAIERFCRWIVSKPPDFHAPTQKSR